MGQLYYRDKRCVFQTLPQHRDKCSVIDKPEGVTTLNAPEGESKPTRYTLAQDWFLVNVDPLPI